MRRSADGNSGIASHHHAGVGVPAASAAEGRYFSAAVDDEAVETVREADLDKDDAGWNPLGIPREAHRFLRGSRDGINPRFR